MMDTPENNQTKDLLNSGQAKAYQALIEGKNVFLTGKAGSGKSFVIKKFLEYAEENQKNVMVCAPTGLAALHINGITLHRAFKAPIGPIIQVPKGENEALCKADIVVIDEISMCRVDLFNYMVRALIGAFKCSKHRKQLVVVGDFFQLPPVLTEKEQDILREAGLLEGEGFAFESPYWEQCKFTIIVLDEVMRQKDGDFIEHLNKIREGDFDPITWLNKTSQQEVNRGIYLCATNKQSKEINEKELEKLDTSLYLFEAEETGDITAQDRITEQILKVKEGARVMMLYNDEDKGFRNGTLGTIKEIDCKNEKLHIAIDDGEIVEVSKYEWKILNYGVGENGRLEKIVVGTFRQLPIKLAYAITIHKSQGQTYNEVNLYPSCFAPGQLYVALSRCKSIETLHLMNQISTRNLITSSRVKRFYETINRQNIVSKPYLADDASVEDENIVKVNTSNSQNKLIENALETVSIEVPAYLVSEVEAFIQERLNSSHF